MIHVQVGDQHGVEVPRRRGRRPLAAQVCDPRAQYGIGEQPRTGDVEEHGGVPDIGEAAWSPAFHKCMAAIRSAIQVPD